MVEVFDSTPETSLNSRPQNLIEVDELAVTSSTPTEVVSESVLDTEEVSDQFDRTNEKLEFQDQLQTLYTLLQELGYQPELIVAEAGDISRALVFKLPAGRSERAVVVDHNTIETILDMELQSWRSLRKYDGVWNSVEGTIEVLINERHGAPLRYGLHRVPNASKVDESWASVPEVVLTDKESSATIRIGSMSNEGIALIRRGYRSYTSRQVSVRVSNVSIATTDAADQLIERITDSLNFDLHVSHRLPVVPALLREMPKGRRAKRSGKKSPISFPNNSYRHEAIALYNSGTARSSSPLIRYWSFYQVLEYFFPHFDKQVAVAELSRFLRNPLFDPHDEESVLNVAELASAVSNNAKNEEEQLYTTLRSVVSELEVKGFIRDHELEEHLSDKNSELSTVRIQVSREEDILRRLAERIYAIRCGIVHSKSTNSKGAGSGLLPGTHHDDLILIELPLIEFLAQQALLKTATKFQI